MSDADDRRMPLTGAVRASEMLARGLRHKPFVRTSRGPLFVGRHAHLSNLRFVSHTGRLVIEDGAEVDGRSLNGLTFGRDVSIGARTSIRPSSYYGGEPGWGLHVGDRSSFATGCFIGCSGRTVIGNDVMFGPGVQLHSENHDFDRSDVNIKTQGVTRSHVLVEDDCWIGAGSVITAGVTIGHGVVVGAGSVVTTDIPPLSIAVGSPARVVRTRSAEVVARGER